VIKYIVIFKEYDFLISLRCNAFDDFPLKEEIGYYAVIPAAIKIVRSILQLKKISPGKYTFKSFKEC
jgi:hypothetical protein